jgi:hypothetical protein
LTYGALRRGVETQSPYPPPTQEPGGARERRAGGEIGRLTLTPVRSATSGSGACNSRPKFQPDPNAASHVLFGSWDQTERERSVASAN